MLQCILARSIWSSCIDWRRRFGSWWEAPNKYCSNATSAHPLQVVFLSKKVTCFSVSWDKGHFKGVLESLYQSSYSLLIRYKFTKEECLLVTVFFHPCHLPPSTSVWDFFKAFSQYLWHWLTFRIWESSDKVTLVHTINNMVTMLTKVLKTGRVTLTQDSTLVLKLE